MKKTFEQPELMVVRLNNNDVIATSDTLQVTGTINSGEASAADRFRDFEDF